MSDDGSSTSTTGGTTTGAAPTTGTSGTSTTDAVSTTTGTTAVGDTTSSTGGSTTTSDSTGSTTGDDIPSCQSLDICEEGEHCTPEARVNADITGMTPLGPFTGTFAHASAAIAFGYRGELRVIPAYATELCQVEPALLIELGSLGDGEDFVIEAPVSLDDGQGNVVQTIATVHVKDCCSTLWFCWCDSPSPYTVEISVIAEGWSLAGSARPNCCRSHSIDEAA